MRIRFGVIGIILAAVMSFSGCSIKNPFKKETKEAPAAATNNQTAVEKKKEVVTNSNFTGIKDLENKYNLKRKNLDNARNTDNLKELKAFEDTTNSKASSIKTAYEGKITTRNNALQDKIKKELDIELERIKAEFGNAKIKLKLNIKRKWQVI